MAATALGLNATQVAVRSPNAGELTNAIVRHLPYFRRMAQHRLGNFADAEDAVQDALLSAWAHIDQFRGQAKMATWLTSIVINSVRMKLRRRSHVQIGLDERNQEQSALLVEVLSDHRPSPEEVCSKRELADRLARATAQLSPILRRTFELRDLEGLSIEEAAHLLGVPGGTVKARLVRARRRLKEILKKRLRGKDQPISSTVVRILKDGELSRRNLALTSVSA
jgi:RNA polymerase sigma-70 factor (ECF subfamily)